ncbi:MAG: hypothetical protein CO118_06765 [Flavobacteriales bacterium CG_4_9_14_3_um_filter_32_8]|nr:MAG: hypothetical protein CO118_06765 [Flavobacteriales bacterium CG_4_9_14_3_um_filter_32_8]
MKTILSFLLVFTFSNLTIAQTTAIPDANFEQALINLGLDATIDGQVLTANIDTLTSLDVSFKNISDLTGIEAFIALIYFNCRYNQITNIDVTQNTALTSLICAQNYLTSLDVTQNIILTDFQCYQNQLTSLDVTQNNTLSKLRCDGNSLTSLDITQNTSLTYLDCYENNLTSLDVTQNTVLTHLNCFYNQLTSLDLTQNTALSILECSINNLTSLDVTQNTALTDLGCTNNLLTGLDVTQNTSLTILECYYNNELTCLNVKNGNNTNFLLFVAIGNPLLTCIEVDNVAYSTTNWTNIDPASSFSTWCNNPCSVGIEENSLSNLSLYPNPTTGNITIDLGEVKQGVKATLTNSLGQVVLTQNYVSTTYINLNLAYPNGLYFLTLATAREVISKKIIKQ